MLMCAVSLTISQGYLVEGQSLQKFLGNFERRWAYQRKQSRMQVLDARH